MYTYVNVYIYMCIYKHTLYTYITCIHYIYICIHTKMYIYVHIYMCTYKPTLYTWICIYIEPHSRECIHMKYTCAYASAYIWNTRKCIHMKYPCAYKLQTRSVYQKEPHKRDQTYHQRKKGKQFQPTWRSVPQQELWNRDPYVPTRRPEHNNNKQKRKKEQQNEKWNNNNQ